MPPIIGYARVSTVDQRTDTQAAQLKAAGCSPIRVEKVSGKSRDGRSELAAVLDFIRAGDTLVVVKLDRLGRSTRDVLNIVHELEERGAHLRVLEPAISTEGPMGKMVLTVLGMVAEMELGFIKTRQRDGIEAAKKRGVYKGRPPTPRSWSDCRASPARERGDGDRPRVRLQPGSGLQGAQHDSLIGCSARERVGGRGRDDGRHRILGVRQLLCSVARNYLHFQRVDSYKDFPRADAQDGEQPTRDRIVNEGIAFEKTPNYSVADYYDNCRARSYACSFSLSNSPLIWERYGADDPIGKVCLVFDFGKLRSVLNRRIGNAPGQSALIVGSSQCKQIFHINYGLIDYVNLSAVQTNLEQLANPIVYSYMKDRDRFGGENELRITLATLGLGNFALADNSIINFPPSMQLLFDFRTACADRTIARLICQKVEVARHLTQELSKFKILVEPELG